MKRKGLDIVSGSVSNYTRSKRPKLWSGELPTRLKTIEYISATNTKNFMLKDTLVDWLKEHGSHSNRLYEGGKDFSNFIMDRGIEFETELVKYINKFKIPVVTVSEYITNESINKTIQLMKEGIPIIHSAPVRNTKNHTHGIIDLLVRSDYIDQLVDDCPLSDEEQIIPSPKLGKQYHYIVIDIKFSTLPLRADGKHLLNIGNYPAYKAQCLIYTDAIGLIQGYTSQYAYILGRRWKCRKKGINYNNFECLDKLGVIDYKNIDNQYVQQTIDALLWLRENKKFGHQWSVSPPSRRELYPNMSLDSGKWQKQKIKIAEEIGEISSIWYCGVKNREIALDNGIKSWRNPKCVSSNIGLKGKRANIIDSILEINRQDVDKIRPKKILNNIFNWKNEGNEIFVDFETLSDIFCSFSELPEQKSTDMIFMIGVYWKPKQKSKWEYKRFTCKKATYEEEYRIMNEFATFIKKQKKNTKLWYWCAENRFWKISENRQFDFAIKKGDKQKMDCISNNWKLFNWVDMCNIFKEEPIVIKDCFKFGLKPIAIAMKKHNLIKTKLDSECNSGMSAMIKAWKCYQDFSDPANCPIMQDISKYNKFDVQVLKDILSYLRKNHI
jgi:hypothetical protein